MSDYEIGFRKPPRAHQFAPGNSGNKAGRPKKRGRQLLPRQRREDVLQIMEEVIEINTPSGPRKVTRDQLVILALFQAAVTDKKISAIKEWLNITGEALADRLKNVPGVSLLEHMLDSEQRQYLRLHDFMEPGYDLEKITKKLL